MDFYFLQWLMPECHHNPGTSFCWAPNCAQAALLALLVFPQCMSWVSSCAPWTTCSSFKPDFSLPVTQSHRQSAAGKLRDGEALTPAFGGTTGREAFSLWGEKLLSLPWVGNKPGSMIRPTGSRNSLVSGTSKLLSSLQSSFSGKQH